MRIKKEYLDSYFYSPITNKLVVARLIDKSEYPIWYKKIPEIFEDVKLKYFKL